MTRRTAYGAVTQVAQLLGINSPEEFTLASTLNATLDIQATTLPSAGERPLLRYFCMGIGAHAYREGVNGIALPSTKNHTAKDAGLFRMIPFCVRDTDNDLEEAERARYALRRIENIQGVNKVVYYARRMDLSGSEIVVNEVTIENGRVTETNPFTPTAADREPVAIDNSNVVTNPLTAKGIRVSCMINITLDAFDVAEILNAAQEVYGSEDYSHVSEIGVMTGVDRIVQSPTGAGATINFNEVIQAQIHTHVPAQLAMKERRAGLSLSYDVAASEVLYVNGA